MTERIKTCKSCSTSKPASLFHGASLWCKVCFSEKRKLEYLALTPEQIESNNARARRYYAAHRKKIRARQQANAEQMSQYMKVWGPAYYQNNKAAFAAKSAARRAAKLKASPEWSIKFFVEEAYDLAAKRTQITGFEWHVDHIVPLQHPLVCGLHSHTNIQVIPAKSNLAKGNFFWPDMW